MVRGAPRIRRDCPSLSARPDRHAPPSTPVSTKPLRRPAISRTACTRSLEPARNVGAIGCACRIARRRTGVPRRAVRAVPASVLEARRDRRARPSQPVWSRLWVRCVASGRRAVKSSDAAPANLVDWPVFQPIPVIDRARRADLSSVSVDRESRRVRRAYPTRLETHGRGGGKSSGRRWGIMPAGPGSGGGGG